MDEFLLYSIDEIDQLIQILKEKGIITRKEWPSIDLRSYGRGLEKALKEHGFSNVKYCEFEINSYTDYTGAIFDTSVFDYQSVEKYMINNVLACE